MRLAQLIELAQLPEIVGDRLIAINRSIGEDSVDVLDDLQIAELFDGLDLNRIQLASQGGNSLVQEIWRLCLALMLLALIVEAALCLPRLGVRRPGSEASPA